MRSATRSRRGGGTAAPGPGRRSFAPLFAELLVLAALLVPPFLVWPTLGDAFELPKLVVSEWLGLASLLVLAWWVQGVERVTLRTLWATPALAAVVPFLVVATLSLATTAHPAHVRAALPDLWIGAACLVGWSVGLSARHQRRVLLALLVPASVLALFAVLQFHDLYRPFAFAGGEEGARLGISSLAGNVGVLGSYLVLPALLAQSWLRRSWRRRRGATAAVAVALALCLYGIAVSQTLAAAAAVLTASAVLWLLLLPVRRALPAAALALLLAAGTVAALPPLRARVVTKVGQLAAGDWNKAMAGRLDGWRAALWMFARHPLAGVGHGAYVADFAAAKLDLAASGAPLYAGAAQPMFANAHDEPLEVAADGGVPALAALAWGLWLLVSGLLRHRRSSATAGEERALAWAGLTALAVLALFHFPFRVALVAFPALLFLAWTFQLGSERAA